MKKLIIVAVTFISFTSIAADQVGFTVKGSMPACFVTPEQALDSAIDTAKRKGQKKMDDFIDYDCINTEAEVGELFDSACGGFTVSFKYSCIKVLDF